MNYRSNKVAVAAAASIPVTATLALYAATAADPQAQVSATPTPLCIKGITAIQVVRPPTDPASQAPADAGTGYKPISPNSGATSPSGGTVLLIDEVAIDETTKDRN